MHIVLSPAKSLQFDRSRPELLSTQILLPQQAQEIMQALSKYSAKSLQQLHHISAELAQVNFQRNRQWSFPFAENRSLQAILAFNGDVYEGLQAMQMGVSTMEYAQNHLSILSGLYGLLRPLDRMLPYRLEMGTSMEVANAHNLYTYWGSVIGQTLHSRMEQSGDTILVNLASAEYFKALRPAKLQTTIVTPEFKQRKNNKLQNISFFAKRARGRMARFILENRLTNPNDLLAFEEEGYFYSPRDSKPDAPVFVREGAQG